MPITLSQYQNVREKIIAIGPAYQQLLDLVAKVDRRLGEPEFPQQISALEAQLISLYGQRRTAVLDAANALPQVT